MYPHCANAVMMCCCWPQFILDRLDASSRLTTAPVASLLSYAFPGNVRELENMLERAVTLCSSGTISAADLRRQPGADTSIVAVKPGGKLGDQVEDIQRQAIVEALEKTRYNKTAAAKLLGCRSGNCAIASRNWA